MAMIEDPLGLVGTRIDDKYEVESVVGEGGFAIVYRAKHLIFKRYVAIKAFRALTDYSEAERDTLVQAFIQEGALLADLSERSAAIVQARDFGTLTTAKGEWIPYMVLEWLEGASLDAVIERDVAEGVPPRTLEETVKLLEPVAEALALAHKRGVAHRDVKPDNIFVLGDPRGDATVKLLDFGIAKVVQDAQKAAGSFTKTSGNVTSFTPAYGAPEQFDRSHGATGPWTDVFALALVATQLLTHQAPLQGDTFVQLGFASGNPGKRPTPRSLGASVTDEVEAVFAKALSVHIEERYAGAGEFWNALREALHMKPMRMSMVDSGPRSQPAMTASFSTANTLAVPSSASTGTPVVQSSSVTTPPPPRRAGLFVAVVAVVLLVGGVSGFLLMNGKSDGGKGAASASASATPHVAVVKPLPSCPKGMVYVDGGEFFMGSNDAKAGDDEKPSHHVELSAFCIDRTEVTVAAYKGCSDVGKCPPASRENSFSGLDDKLKKVLDPLCNVREPQGKGDHPINCIDWESSATYCAKQGGRLPTEAEWEFAARGPDGRAYPSGDEPPSSRFLNACGSECLAWGKKNGVAGSVTYASMYADDDKYATTAPVGSFPDGKSRYGLVDVVGNVWEWTADYYADYTKDSVKDPEGPKSGEHGRVARGGAWNGADPSWVRPTFRFHFDPKSQSYGVGFRCAATPK